MQIYIYNYSNFTNSGISSYLFLFVMVTCHNMNVTAKYLDITLSLESSDLCLDMLE